MLSLIRPGTVLIRAARIVKCRRQIVEQVLFAVRESLFETLAGPNDELAETAVLLGCIMAPVWVGLVVVATYASSSL